MSVCCVGIDVGGSHISLSLIDCGTGEILDNAVYKQNIDPQASATQIINSWDSFITGVLNKYEQENILGIGVAMPGPFDYERGISQITGVQKYESLFGLNIKQAIRHIFKNRAVPVSFINDAAAYALGEYYAGAILGNKRSIFVSLGTGFGSAFLVDGVLQTSGEEVPKNGYLYNWPVEDGIADDKLSTRWFIQEWHKKTGIWADGVKELAEKARKGDQVALDIFERFTENLARLMTYWVGHFNADSLVIGGNIARASDIFLDKLTSQINTSGFHKVKIKITELWENAPLIGAAMHVHQINQCSLVTEKRKTTQQLIPEKVFRTTPGKYNIYPGFPIGDGKIGAGNKALAEWIAQHKTVIIEGYVGVLWENFVANIDKELAGMGKKALWFHTDAALHSPQEINEMLEPYLGGDDPVFGRITDKQLSDWYDNEKLRNIKPDVNADINIVVGCGASLCGWQAPLVYVDLPKNELQFRMRAGCITNLGAERPMDAKQMYKRFYFIDWRVLNEHKRKLLPQIDLIVDEQRIDNYLFMSGDELRKGLSAMGRNFFRVRPWFEPGVWGGTWMKKHIEGLNDGGENLAWSFELMVLENGLLFESDHRVLEVSFDFLMYNNYREVLGDAAARFEYDFPIRFDFLDTFDGGNLSIQCHPSNEYIKKNFGMPFTQDETYYIMDCKEDAEVYLGFREGVDREEFYNTLIQSHDEEKEIDILHYVQTFPAERHKLYLIPNGTIHASGKNNMVLEISSAPYIFTFKMYDWMRLDMDGKPRPINIEHGMNNLHFDRQGDVVSDELISRSYVLEKTNSYTIEHLPTHGTHFYDVHRYSFDREICIETQHKCHVWMLVEGSSVTLKTQDGMEYDFNYAETFVIPAAAKCYTLVNNGNRPAVMVKSFVK
ncbi:Sugar kinase of the NBD/HSP70 family, may contain an N-terminal HTH domain [Porphyromonadaceae bacterium KH3CP3RA]|nr:Sugar kinase of the NBD/HSP70 family, may contain an N-terminal HTH domain [Porphyromonadaceae bacterium KH3CP3RA]